MNIKLIGIDLDGTLLDDQKLISEENIKSIKKATKKGIKVILATGRPLNDIVIQYHKQLGLYKKGQVFVGYNGSSIIDVYNNKFIETDMMKLDNVREVFNFAEAQGAACYAYLSDILLYNHLNEYVLKERYYNNSNFGKIQLDNLPCDFECFKVMIAEDPITLDRIEANIPLILKEKYTILRSMPHYLEFISKTADKFSALKKIAINYGIKDEEIMAIGDSMNDFPFINAGYSVAMENSVGKIKESFKYTTLSNNDSGVAYIINKLINGNE